MERASKSRAEARQVSATINCVDVVGKRIDFFVVAVVVLNGDFNRQGFALFFEIDRFVVERSLVLVQVLDEFGDAPLVIKLVRTLRLLTLVLNRYADTLVEKSLFAQTFRKLVETARGFSEDLCVRLESDLGSAFASLSRLLEWSYRYTSNVFLLISLSVAPDLQAQMFGYNVNA